MPAVPQGKVLVTGANGYLALWVVERLLNAGYSVRGAVRSESKIAHLKETFKEHADKVEFVVVPDITKEGAFDEAVKGVDAIAHTASPYHLRATDPAELLEPAVKGTLSILRSALKHANDTVKRIVVTSSTAAVVHPVNGPRVFTEADWNNTAVQEVETKGRDAHPGAMYQASKVLAERAAWEFVESNKGEVKFDLVTLNPPFIYGPVLHEVESPEALNTSMNDWFQSVVKGAKSEQELVSNRYSWVDVRDIALAHVLSIQKEEAGGERIIIAAGCKNWQDWVIAAHKFDSSLPVGNTTYDPETAEYPSRYDSSKSTRVLGIKYHTLEETTVDTIKQFKQKGWIN